MVCLSVSETTDQVSGRGKHSEPNYLMNTPFVFFGSLHGEKNFETSLKSGCFTQDRVANASRNGERPKTPGERPRPPLSRREEDFSGFLQFKGNFVPTWSH